jgi:HEAT repeat protein
VRHRVARRGNRGFGLCRTLAPVRVESIVTDVGRDLVVAFFSGERQLTIQRALFIERLLPAAEWGAAVTLSEGGRDVSAPDDRLVSVSRRGETLAIETAKELTLSLDLESVETEDVDRAMAVLEQMNFDERIVLSGIAPTPATTEVALELLDSDEPYTVIGALMVARRQQTELAGALLEEISHPPDPDSNLQMLAFYLLAEWRDTRALDPIVRFFETGGEDAIEAAGDVVPQDLPTILYAVARGRFDPIERLARNPALDPYLRSSALEALAIGAANADYPLDRLEALMEPLTVEALQQEDSDFLDLIVMTAADIASTRLLPLLTQGYEQGIIDDRGMMSLEELQNDVRRGTTRALADYRRRRPAEIDDVIRATRWWSFFAEKDRDDPRIVSPDIGAFDPDEDFDDAYLPLLDVPGTIVRETAKIGRNEPCPCGSGRKYKKCCGR